MKTNTFFEINRDPWDPHHRPRTGTGFGPTLSTFMSATIRGILEFLTNSARKKSCFRDVIKQSGYLFFNPFMAETNPTSWDHFTFISIIEILRILRAMKFTEIYFQRLWTRPENEDQQGIYMKWSESDISVFRGETSAHIITIHTYIYGTVIIMS